MTNKEISLTFIPEHFDRYIQYFSSDRKTKYKDSKKVAFWLLGIGIALSIACYFSQPLCLLILSFFNVVLILNFIHERWQYRFETKKEKKNWKDWIETNTQKGYYKLEYNDEKMVLFSKDESFERNWNSWNELIYTKDYLSFHQDDNSKNLVLPRLTIGDLVYEELLIHAKIKIFNCTVMSFEEKVFLTMKH